MGGQQRVTRSRIRDSKSCDLELSSSHLNDLRPLPVRVSQNRKRDHHQSPRHFTFDNRHNISRSPSRDSSDYRHHAPRTIPNRHLRHHDDSPYPSELHPTSRRKIPATMRHASDHSRYSRRYDVDTRGRSSRSHSRRQRRYTHPVTSPEKAVQTELRRRFLASKEYYDHFVYSEHIRPKKEYYEKFAHTPHLRRPKSRKPRSRHVSPRRPVITLKRPSAEPSIDVSSVEKPKPRSVLFYSSKILFILHDRMHD